MNCTKCGKEIQEDDNFCTGCGNAVEKSENFKSEKSIISAVGINGQVEVFENRIDIMRKGFKAFMIHGFDGTKSIFLSKLTALQFKEPGAMTSGFIQFIFPGSLESKEGLFDAAKDENSVLFDKKSLPDFIKLKEYIISKIQ